MTLQTSCRLYAITPPKIDLTTFIPQVEQAFAAGNIACLQLRLKEATNYEIIDAIKALMPLCHAHDAAFILNDSLKLGLQLNVDGVHLGQEDLEEFGGDIAIKAIRAEIPHEMTLGITCHASKHLAMEAGEQGADYVAFGAFYPTTSKPQEKLDKWGTPTVELLQDWTELTTIPSVAIGGITPKNCTPLVQHGADFIAVINGLWNHPQGAGEGVIAYNEAIANALK